MGTVFVDMSFLVSFNISYRDEDSILDLKYEHEKEIFYDLYNEDFKVRSD